MHYFIPEWDDRVDSSYNFLTDKFTENRKTDDDIYSHEIYNSPNYDGILVSKVIIDKIRSRKNKITAAGGIHKFLRFSGEIMGDCGAFGYVKDEVPRYSTEEILDYYHTLKFDYGVSIDHLIFGPFAEPGIREKRYELTLENAQDFINKHHQGNYKFTPIGAVQGWNPTSYSQGVQKTIEMGYDYIALGGLARAKTQDIIEILREIQPHLKPNIRMHLFGVGRIEATLAFRHLGVTSFDSASSLRRAWLGS
ncbi:MAG: tRNA-guanine transglycosylase DpdA, partial [Planktothrix sp.]